MHVLYSNTPVCMVTVSNAEAIINSINVSELRLLYHALWYPANVVFQRLRSLIERELLESLLLCSVEFDLLKAIGNAYIP